MIFNRALFILFLLIYATTTKAQVNRYFVSFKDKAGSLYTTDDPSKYLSDKSIQRRSKQNVAITATDFPVNENYVEDVRGTGASVYYKSRWFNGALIQCDASLVDDIAALSSVKSVELVAPGAKLLNGGRKQEVEEINEEPSTATARQLHMVGIDSMHHLGYTGTDITIAVMDAGFPNVNSSEFFSHLFADGKIDLAASYDFVFNTPSVFQYDQHGAKVLSVLAAYKEGVFSGSAYEANFLLYVTEDVESEYRVEEYNWLFAVERADSAGVDIVSTSVGYNTFDLPSMNYEAGDLDGNTAVITRAAQLASERGILVVSAAGNEGGNGWGLILPPADAKDVLTVGNVNIFGERSQTSSTGPTADGRTKPDVAGLGTNISVVLPSGSLATASGTSYSAPLVAGLMAGLWQRYPALTNKELMEVLRHTASQSTQPDVFLGWGIPNFVAVKNYLDYHEQSDVFDVFPNPFHDVLTVRPKHPEQISSCTMSVHNVQGQLMETRTASFNWLNPSAQGNFSNLAPGLYLLKIVFQQQVYVAKVIKR